MGNKGKWLICALCLVMVFALASCSMVSVNEERDNAQVVAEVNGTQITKDKYRVLLDNMLSSYGVTEEQLKEEDDPNLYKQQVLDNLVEQELMYQQAEKEGLVDNSEENREAIRTEQQEYMDSMKEYFISAAGEDADEAAKAEAEKNFQDYVVSSGMDDVEKYINDQIKSNAINDMYDKIVADVTYTEEEAKAYFDEQVAAQQPLVEKDAKNFSFYQMGNQAYVNPEGSKYVKNLLISIPGEVQTEISNMRQSGQEAEADKLLQEELAKIKADADAALKRVKDGEDFDKVMEELGTDPGMQSDPGKTYGYLVYEGASYVQPFIDGSLALQNVGDISDLIPTDYGYHIIKYVKDGAGPVDFEMVKQDIIDTKLSARQNETYTNYVDGLKEQAKTATYINRV